MNNFRVHGADCELRAFIRQGFSAAGVMAHSHAARLGGQESRLVSWIFAYLAGVAKMDHLLGLA